MYRDYAQTPEPHDDPPAATTRWEWIAYGLLICLLILGGMYALSMWNAAQAARMV